MRSNSPTPSQIATSILPPPPPRPKIRQKFPSKNNVATPSPGRSSPRPRMGSMIVVLLRSSTGRGCLIRPPSCKLRPLSYPVFDKQAQQIENTFESVLAIQNTFKSVLPKQNTFEIYLLSLFTQNSFEFCHTPTIVITSVPYIPYCYANNSKYER